MSSSTSSGAASAPAPSGCSVRAACRPSPAWAIRSFPATKPSAGSSRRAATAGYASVSASSCRARRCYGDVRGLFGGAASHLVVPARASPLFRGELGDSGVLLALAATAHHALGDVRAARRRADRRPWRARPADRAACRRRRRRADRLGAQLRNARAAPKAIASSIPTDDARRDYRVDLRRQRRSDDPRRSDRASRAGRRDRARRLLRAAARFRLSAGLHARGAPPHRRRMAPDDLAAVDSVSSRTGGSRSTA